MKKELDLSAKKQFTHNENEIRFNNSLRRVYSTVIVTTRKFKGTYTILEAEDIIQDVIEKFYKKGFSKLNECLTDQDVDRYLIRSFNNYAIDIHRKEKRLNDKFKMIKLDLVNETNEDFFQEEFINYSILFKRLEEFLGNRNGESIDRLAVRAFELQYLHKHTRPEIAKMLGLSKHQVDRYISKIKKLSKKYVFK